MIVGKHSRRYLREMGSGYFLTASLSQAEIDIAEGEVRIQHPEEPFPRERAIARLTHLKHGSKRSVRWLFLAFLALLGALWLSVRLQGQTTSVDIKRVGGTLVTTSVPVTCLAGCGGAGGTQDVNLIQYLGVAPGATNPVAIQLSNGIAFYDGRDRNWTLNSGTDSVSVVGTFWQALQPVQISDGVNQPNILSLAVQPTDADYGLLTMSMIHGHTTAGGGTYVDVKVTPSGALSTAATQDTSPWVVSGTVSATQGTSPWVVSGTATVSGTVTADQGAAGAAAWPIKISQSGTDSTVVATQGTGTNLHTVVDSGSITATQGTGTNLHTVVDSGAVTVSGTVTADAGTGTFTVGQATGTNLHMVCDSGCTPGGSFSDDSAFTFGSTAIGLTGFVVDDVGTNTVAENSAGAARMNTNRILYADLSQSAANTNKFLVTADPVTGTVTANQGTAAATTAGWPNISGTVANSTATWTSATPLNTALTATVMGYNTASFTIVDDSGSFSSGSVSFEGSLDNSTWFSWPCVQPKSGTVGFSRAVFFAFLSNTNRLYQCNVAGLSNFRLSLSAAIVGTGTASLVLAVSNAKPIDIRRLNPLDDYVSAYMLNDLGDTISHAGQGLDSTGTGLLPSVAIGIFDDSSPQTVTENNFGNLRMSSKGVLYNQIRDAAGNERGANVTSTNDVQVQANNSGATGSAVPSRASYVGGNGTGNLTGFLRCDNSVVYDTNTNGKTQLVGLTSGQTIYVCGVSLSQSTTSAVTVSLGSGTGTNCGTTYTAKTPAWPLQAPTSVSPIGMVLPVANVPWFQTAASEELCISTNAAVSVQALVVYTKF